MPWLLLFPAVGAWLQMLARESNEVKPPRYPDHACWCRYWPRWTPAINFRLVLQVAAGNALAIFMGTRGLIWWVEWFNRQEHEAWMSLMPPIVFVLVFSILCFCPFAYGMARLMAASEKINTEIRCHGPHGSYTEMPYVAPFYEAVDGVTGQGIVLGFAALIFSFVPAVVKWWDPAVPW